MLRDLGDCVILLVILGEFWGFGGYDCGWVKKGLSGRREKKRGRKGVWYLYFFVYGI